MRPEEEGKVTTPMPGMFTYKLGEAMSTPTTTSPKAYTVEDFLNALRASFIEALQHGGYSSKEFDTLLDHFDSAANVARRELCENLPIGGKP